VAAWRQRLEDLLAAPAPRAPAGAEPWGQMSTWVPTSTTRSEGTPR